MRWLSPLVIAGLLFPLGASAKKVSCTTGFKSCAERDAWRASVGRAQSPYPSPSDVAFGSTFYPFRELACSTENTAAANLAVNDPLDALNVNCLLAGAGNFNDYCLFKKAYDSLDKQARLGDQRRSLVILLRQFVELVQAKRTMDLKAQQDFQDRNGVSRAVDMDQVRKAMNEFSAHVRAAAAGPGLTSTMRGFIDTYVAQQILDDSRKQ